MSKKEGCFNECQYLKALFDRIRIVNPITKEVIEDTESQSGLREIGLMSISWTQKVKLFLNYTFS